MQTHETVSVPGIYMATDQLDELSFQRIFHTKKGKEEYLYSAFIQRLVSKHSDMDHTVLPANYTMPAFPFEWSQ